MYRAENIYFFLTWKKKRDGPTQDTFPYTTRKYVCTASTQISRVFNLIPEGPKALDIYSTPNVKARARKKNVER